MARKTALARVMEFVQRQTHNLDGELMILSRPCIELEEGEEILEQHLASIPIHPGPADWVFVVTKRGP